MLGTFEITSLSKRKRAETERKKAEKLAAKLMELGINPEDI
ncbi:MAG: hypothetical protein AB4057_23605 [Crocosphaera sp.]